jgi:hypothetical protein
MPLLTLWASVRICQFFALVATGANFIKYPKLTPVPFRQRSDTNLTRPPHFGYIIDSGAHFIRTAQNRLPCQTGEGKNSNIAWLPQGGFGTQVPPF